MCMHCAVTSWIHSANVRANLNEVSVIDAIPESYEAIPNVALIALRLLR